MRGYNIYFTFKAISNKYYGNLQALPIFMYYKKNLSIYIMTKLLIIANEKNNNYDLILVLIHYSPKVVYYELVKMIINTPNLVKVFINIIVKYFGLLKSIISNRDLLFNFK